MEIQVLATIINITLVNEADFLEVIKPDQNMSSWLLLALKSLLRRRRACQGMLGGIIRLVGLPKQN